jgi:dTMP kinase
MRGRLITLEGGEGAGKTTALSTLARLLREAGHVLWQTREPGGTPLAEELRELLLRPRTERLHPSAELLMVFAARAQHWHTAIEPRLAAGEWVLSDRFTEATYAYQGAGRGLDTQLIAWLEHQVQGEHRPDMTFYLDVPVDVGLARAKQRGELDRFEQEQQAFFERVREGYWQQIRACPERFCVVDASQPLEKVQADLTLALERYLTATP